MQVGPSHYNTCLAMTLDSMLTTSCDILTVKSLHDEYSKKPDKDLNIAHAFLRCIIKNAPSSPFARDRVAMFMRHVIDTNHVDPSSFYALLPMPEKEHFTILTKISKIAIRAAESASDVTCDGDSEHPGFVSYTQLCDHVAKSRFTKYDNPGSRHRKLYDVYSRLESLPLRQQFMSDYLDHNRDRQLYVEKHCLSMIAPLVKPSTSSAVFLFRAQYLETVFLWFELSIAEIEQVMEGKYKETEATKKLSQSHKEKPNTTDTTLEFSHQKVSADIRQPHHSTIWEYRALILLAKPTTLVTLILSHLILLTASLGRVTLADLITAINRLFAHVCKSNKTLSQLLRLYTEDDYVRLFTAIISVLLPHCVLDKKLLEEAINTRKLGLLRGDNNPVFWEGTKLPAFVHRMVGKKNKIIGLIVMHPWIHAHFAEASSSTSHQLYLPMLVPPKLWQSGNGGYLLDLKTIMTYDYSDVDILQNAAHVRQSIDTLSQLPWAVNSQVFRVFDEVMKRGKPFLAIPPSHDNIMRSKRKQTDKAELRSVRTHLDNTRAFAAALDANGDVFYLPHQLDFRGRAYPMVLVLLHHMDDVCRLLLMFWEGRALGPDGYKWLQYQLVGVFGHSKMTMEERLLFVQRNWDNIVALTTNPLAKNAWWKSGEKPWQVLGLCFECVAVHQHIQAGNAADTYVSRIPVHQDGTCNGLQHYAALGRDEVGAIAVNLAPSAERQDVYHMVLEKVRAAVAEDARAGLQVAQHVLSSNILSRQLVKQTVMTTVYGVSLFGATRQILSKMEKNNVNDIEVVGMANDLSASKTYAAINFSTTARPSFTTDISDYRIANYLGQQILGSINSLFLRAQQIQQWITENCERMCTSFHTDRDFECLSLPFRWTTPLGMSVVQMYRLQKVRQVATVLQKISFLLPRKRAPIDIQKQCRGAAPNFVHSLDATHMHMTAIEAARVSQLFAAVHDLYWTHACDVAQLQGILRHQFVHLHQQDIMGEMQREWQELMKHSVNVVYFNNKVYDVLGRAIRRSRVGIPKPEIFKEELAQIQYWITSSHKTYVPPIIKLVQEHLPPLYKRRTFRLTILEPYSNNLTIGSRRNKKLLSDFTPILVPVILKKPPALGSFDVAEVLKSPSFFS